MFEVFESTESQVRSYCRKYPVVFSKAKNSEIFSVDGERYIDFLAVAGSMNYGHNNPEIKAKIMEYLSEDHIINALYMYTDAKEEFLLTFNEKILKPRNLNYKEKLPVRTSHFVKGVFALFSKVYVAPGMGCIKTNGYSTESCSGNSEQLFVMKNTIDSLQSFHLKGSSRRYPMV